MRHQKLCHGHTSTSFVTSIIELRIAVSANMNLSFQIFCNTRTYKLLHPCATGWLCLHEAVARILEQWQPLKMHFTNMWEDRLTAVPQINDAMRDPFVHCYLPYLNYILPHITSVDIVFQSTSPTSPKLHHLLNRLCNLYRLLLNDFCYLHKVVTSPLHETGPCDVSYHLHTKHLRWG